MREVLKSKKIIVFSSVGILTFAFLTVCFFNSPVWEKRVMRKKVSSYLESKYEEKMVIDQIVAYGSLPFKLWAEYYAVACPASNTNLLFDIEYCYNDSTGIYELNDNYPQLYWSDKATEQIANYISDTWEDFPEGHILYNVSTGDDEFFDKLPTYEEILAKSSGPQFVMVLEYDLSEGSGDEMYGRLWNILKFIDENSFITETVSIKFYTENIGGTEKYLDFKYSDFLNMESADDLVQLVK